MAKSQKDRPLLLRKRKDPVRLEISTDEFPPRHEFSQEWLLENSKWVEMDGENIILKLDNGTATYSIARDLMEDEEGNRLATGYWGILEEGSVDNG